MSKKMTGSIALVTLLAGLIAGRPYLEHYWAYFLDQTNQIQKFNRSLEMSWSSASNSELIKKFRHPSHYYRWAAAEVLSKRNSHEGADRLSEIVRSESYREERVLALRTLIIWKVDSVNSLAMEMLQRGDRDLLFKQALYYLASIKYEPAYPYVLKMWNSPERFQNGSVLFIETFGRRDSIPMLEQAIKDGAKGMDKSLLELAIARLKQAQSNK